MKNKIFNERGQTLIILALAAIGLVGFVGLVIDGGNKFSDQRKAQNAADTAAMAAALAKVSALEAGKSNSPATCESGSPPYSKVCEELLLAGIGRATDNGYDGNPLTNKVEIYSPPISGPYAGRADYVQVFITSWKDTTFSRVIGINRTENFVEAVSYLHMGGALADGAMLISYDPDPNCSTSGTGGYSVQVSGTAEVNLTGGGIFLNSDEVCGFKIPNCADLNIYGGAINSAGNNIDIPSGCVLDPPATTNVNQPGYSIPDDVFWPDVPPECGMSVPTPTQIPTTITGTDGKQHEQWIIYPGYYEDFPPTALVTKKSYIFMASGVYCIDPKGPGDTTDLSWSPVDAAFLNGSTDPAKNPYSSVNPDGVTLYIKKGGGFDINTLSPTYLNASTTGDYQGYLIILEGDHTTHPNCTVNGGADIYLEGLIFAPYCNFTINGKAGETAYINAQLLAWDIKINGSNTINFNFDPSNQVMIKSKIGLMR